jgi:hypothetical protein
MWSGFVLTLCLGVSAAFSNVSHLKTATLAFGSASSADGVDSFFPASDGSTVGVYESYASGADLQYVDGVGQIAGAMILMATASRDVGGNLSVVVTGLFGSAISFDGGHEWEKLDIPVMISQDVKYEKASGLYALTGISLSEPTVAVSSDEGNSFEMITVSGLYNSDIRYGSFPSMKTYFVTAGMWGDASSVKSEKRLSGRLSISEDGSLIHHLINKDTNTSGYWGQVAKTTDGGATWSIVFEDFESGLYPNDIHCYDENTCTFAMEGMGEPQIITTQDGGATWTRYSDQSGGVSLMAVRMTGPTEAFVAGGGDVGRMWHTTDLVNWSATTTDLQDAASLFSFALSEDLSMGYATGVLRSQLCSILKFEF